MNPYLRRAFYYETDQMAIVHHSNYIRWMEEARLDYMRQAGLNYADMEREGVIMPVVSVSCRYLSSVRYDEQASVVTTLTSFNGVRAAFRYQIFRENGAVAAEGESSHCFLDAASRRPVNLKRHMPDFYQQCLKLLEETNQI